MSHGKRSTRVGAMCHSASLGSALTPVGEEGVARHPPSDPVPAVLVAIGPGQGPCGCAGEPGTRKRMTHKKKNSTASLLPAFCVVRGCRKLPKKTFFWRRSFKKNGPAKDFEDSLGLCGQFTATSPPGSVRHHWRTAAGPPRPWRRPCGSMPPS